MGERGGNERARTSGPASGRNGAVVARRARESVRARAIARLLIFHSSQRRETRVRSSLSLRPRRLSPSESGVTVPRVFLRPTGDLLLRFFSRPALYLSSRSRESPLGAKSRTRRTDRTDVRALSQRRKKTFLTFSSPARLSARAYRPTGRLKSSRTK